MEYHILATENKDLPRVVDLNQDALPAVSSITLDDMIHFLEIVDYFRVIKINSNIIPISTIETINQSLPPPPPSEEESLLLSDENQEELLLLLLESESILV